MQPGEKAGTSARTAVTVAVVVAVTTAVTTALTLSAVRDEQPKPQATLAPASIPDRDLQELRAAVHELRESVARLERPAASAQPDVPPSALGPDEFASRGDVAALAAAVQQLVERIDSVLPAKMDPLSQPDPEKRQALLPFLDPKPIRPPETWRYFTESQLIQAYGAPDIISDHMSHPVWIYFLDESGSKTVLFHLIEGRVIRYSLE